MRQAFVFEKVAVLVFPWHEPMEPPERGARVEVRLLADEPAAGTRYAAAACRRRRADVPRRICSTSSANRWATYAAHTSIRTSTGSNRAIATGVRRSSRIRSRGSRPSSATCGRCSSGAGVDVAHAPWIEDDAAALCDAIPVVTAAVERAVGHGARLGGLSSRWRVCAARGPTSLGACKRRSKRGLGARVVEAVSHAAGFSPGLASRLRTDDGAGRVRQGGVGRRDAALGRHPPSRSAHRSRAARGVSRRRSCAGRSMTAIGSCSPSTSSPAALPELPWRSRRPRPRARVRSSSSLTR